MYCNIIFLVRQIMYCIVVYIIQLNVSFSSQLGRRSLRSAAHPEICRCHAVTLQHDASPVWCLSACWAVLLEQSDTHLLYVEQQLYINCPSLYLKTMLTNTCLYIDISYICN